MDKLSKGKVIFTKRYYLSPTEVKIGKRVYKGIRPSQHGVIIGIRKIDSGYPTYITVMTSSGRVTKEANYYQWSDFDKYVEEASKVTGQAFQLNLEMGLLEEKAKKKGLIPK